MFWMLVLLIGVLVTKYSTENAVRKLNARSKDHQKSLSEARHTLATAQEDMAKAEKEERAIKARLERLQAVIADIQVEINESRAHPPKGVPGEAETEGK